ncbi:hypothetical protein HK407_04g06780 [Ordospora pajunii]|jgi:ribosome production factor 2|uniref:uncharacterized protein n=1 Tax=Ordospora pajunii TaxID=3039483 RepID=UPI0029526A43|nr:uncharacterized protein HK407_04g06780 [Ordospora pajunii]KAH9411573.1 hypothetical protein HK407_04g06780 [Ordospora pajunii]
MKPKKSDERKTLLSVVSNEEGERIQKEFSTIRGDAVSVRENVSPFDCVEKIERLMKKKRCGVFFSVTKEKRLVIGRVFNDEMIDIAEFSIDKYMSVSDFECVSPELHMKYFVVVQNIDDARLENLVVDMLNMKSNKVCLDNIRYCWVFARSEAGYVLKYVRVMKDLSIENCGPLFEMQLIRSHHCDEEVYKKAIDEPGRGRKNIKKNVFNDKIGTLHINKQDLREVRLKKIKGYKCSDGGV